MRKVTRHGPDVAAAPTALTVAALTARAHRNDRGGYTLTAAFGHDRPAEVCGMAWRVPDREAVYDAGSPRLRRLTWYCTVEVEDGALEHAYHRTLHDCLVWAVGRAAEAREHDAEVTR